MWYFIIEVILVTLVMIVVVFLICLAAIALAIQYCWRYMMDYLNKKLAQQRELEGTE